MSLVCNIEDRQGFVPPKPDAITLNIKQVKPMIKFLIREGVSLHDILANTGISEPELTRRDINLNASQHQQLLLNAIKLAPDMSFAAQLGEQDFINNDSLLACRVMSSNNVNEAMHLLSDYYKLWTNQFDLCFETNKHWGVFSITPHIDFGDTLPFYIEYLYAILYSFGRFCLGEKHVPLIFEFTYPEPKNSDYYRQHFSDSIRFDQARNRVLLPKQLLSRPLVFSNPELARTNDKDIKSKIETLRATDTVSRVKLLIEKGRIDTVSLESVANQLFMSPRSLRRHLYNEGHTFQELIEDEKKAKAKALLNIRGKSIQEIAILLGYTDSSSFSRAFKRWEGCSPKDFRNSLAEL